MKGCDVCNKLYVDNLEYCPYCAEKGKKILKIIAISVVILFAIILLPVIVSTVTNKDPNIISVSSMGDKYPYTIDNVRLECADAYPNSVYIVDKNKNQYAVNGNAHVYFTKIRPDKNYKGYTTEILKNSMTDAEVLQMGLKICKD